MKQLVLCKRLPNLAFDRSAQKRRFARSWVPSSLRSSAPGQCSRRRLRRGRRAVRWLREGGDHADHEDVRELRCCRCPGTADCPAHGARRVYDVYCGVSQTGACAQTFRRSSRNLIPSLPCDFATKADYWSSQPRWTELKVNAVGIRIPAIASDAHATPTRDAKALGTSTR